ncbi:hypothetical protein LCGC14_1151820 [marine sediment metagenome]|uniref:Uncharacterized protein n=1 Tax=marine sediment metagenome TaxID=412755 RepID=A0A0F9LV80_9ZZZZ
MYLRILVEPRAKGRPRSRIAGKGSKQFVQTYTPADTRKTEAEIVAAIRKQISPEEKFAAKVPLNLVAVFTIVKPPSLPKKRTLPVTAPDLDNYLKLLLDALNKYAFPDDGQIVQLHADKVYGETPMIEVWIEEYGGLGL